LNLLNMLIIAVDHDLFYEYMIIIGIWQYIKIHEKSFQKIKS